MMEEEAVEIRNARNGFSIGRRFIWVVFAAVLFVALLAQLVTAAVSGIDLARPWTPFDKDKPVGWLTATVAGAALSLLIYALVKWRQRGISISGFMALVGMLLFTFCAVYFGRIGEWFMASVHALLAVSYTFLFVREFRRALAQPAGDGGGNDASGEA